MYSIEQLGCKECGRVRKNVKIDWNPNEFPHRNPCICSNPPNQFYKFYLCEKNRDHDAWRPRSQESCPTCEAEKKLITFKHLGVKANGQSVPLASDFAIREPLTTVQIEQIMVANSEQKKKDRELKIISLLEQIAKQNQPSEDHEMMYK